MALESPVQKKTDLLERLVDLFVVLSMEIYSGKLEAHQISNLLGSASISRAVRSNKPNENEKDKYSEIEEKYKDYLSFYETLLDVQTWQNLFHKGFIDANIVNEELKNSQYFTSGAAPDWQKLWYLWHIEDNTLEELYSSVRQSFDREEFLAPGEIKHVYGIFLKLAELELIEEKPSEIFKVCKTYIEKISSKKKLLLDDDALSMVSSRHDGYHGIMFHSRETKHFEDLTAILNTAVEDAYSKDLASQANDVIVRMRTEPYRLSSMLSFSNVEHHPFQNNAVLHNLNAQTFVDVLCDEVTNRFKRDIGSALKLRYEHIAHKPYLIEEEKWLKNIHKKTKDKARKLDQSLKKIALEDFLSQVKKGLEHIENYKKSLENAR